MRAYSVATGIDPLARTGAPAASRDERGGPHRDHSVAVEMIASKCSVLYELYHQAPAVSRVIILVQDAEVSSVDPLASSCAHGRARGMACATFADGE